ncbi:MAG: 2-hydroxyacyl-CoA dehydratase family protein [Dehalococcoidia bacterium]
MKVALDTTKYEAMIAVFEGMRHHRRAHPTTRCDELYYELLSLYFSRVLTAGREGKPAVAICGMVPPEVLYAMDIAPLLLESSGTMLMVSLKNYEDVFATAKQFGLPPEICSVHRAIVTQFIRGWAPHLDALVWSGATCDNCAKTGDMVREIYGMPGFFLDRPYHHGEREIQHTARELKDMVSFLEEHTGRRLDQDRLRESLGFTEQQIALNREIGEMRKAVPSPISNRRGAQLNYVNWLFCGSPQAVEFFTAVRDELREVGEKGTMAPERYRLITVFAPPSHCWNLLDWMEREHGARIVTCPYSSHWGEWDPGLADPIEALAQKCFADPTLRQLAGPLQEAMVQDTVEDALAYGADGALFWAHTGCRHGCAAIRTVRDAVREQAGIPTLALDCDFTDPSFVSTEDMKDKLEGFFDILAERQ